MNTTIENGSMRLHTSRLPRKSNPKHPLKAANVTLALALAVAAACYPTTTSPVCLPGAGIARSGQCTTGVDITHKLPFRAGFNAQVTQGFFGAFSHQEKTMYAVDFDCNQGEPVVATKDGIVRQVRKASSTGCANESCANQANFVIVDHGDGTLSEYYHLKHWGALVKRGQQICAGQVLGLCGSTGWSTGSHLHYSLLDLTNRSVPVRFVEATDPGIGFAVPDTHYVSQNTLTPTCPEVSYSALGTQAFAHQGILLDEPISTDLHTATPHTIRGSYYGDQPQIALNTRHADTNLWVARCVPVQDNRFTMTVDWARASNTPRGFHYMMLSGADAQCKETGWSWSYEVHIER